MDSKKEMNREWNHAPEICQIDITSRCNLKCIHCRASNLDRSISDMSFDQVISILRQLHELSPGVALAVAGGEPLLRKDLRDIFFFIKSKLQGMKIELLSNGILIKYPDHEWLLDTVDGFNISMEGASPEVHDAVRGKGAFIRTVKSLKLLVIKNTNVAVRMTFIDQDESEPENLMRFIDNIGVKMFNFRYVVPVGNAKNKAVDPEQYQRICQRIWNAGKELNMKVGFSDPFPELLINKERTTEIERNTDLLHGVAVTGCSIAFTLLYINPQGIVQLCPYYPVVVADSKIEPLEKIWFENELMRRFRYSRSALEGKCGDCEYKYACGGCRGAAAAMGNALGGEPRCWKNTNYCN